MSERVATGLVLVSHSAMLAAGTVELAAQMAPDVVLRPAGGTDDARLGTSFDVVERAVAAELDAGCSGVVILADIGSARMTAESVVEALDDDRVVLADGAFVEGAVAAAVAAQTGGDVAGVIAAVAAATRQVASELGAPTSEPAGAQASAGQGSDARHAVDIGIPSDLGWDLAEPTGPPAPRLVRTVVVTNPHGLHARPAAALATLAGGFDASVRVAGVDAASLLSLMGLGVVAGDEVEIVTEGAQAREALDAVAAAFEDGFGER